MSAHLILPGNESKIAGLQLRERGFTVKDSSQVVEVPVSRLVGILGTTVVIAILGLSAYFIVHYLL